MAAITSEVVDPPRVLEVIARWTLVGYLLCAGAVVSHSAVFLIRARRIAEKFEGVSSWFLLARDWAGADSVPAVW